DPAASSAPTIPVSLRSCSGKSCGSVATTLEFRRSRCASSNEPAPVPCSGWSSNTCQASFHHSQRLLELIVVKCSGPFAAGAPDEAKSWNQLPGSDLKAVAAITATAQTASAPSAARVASCRARAERACRSSASDPRYASAPTTHAPSTNTSANQAPSCTRTECGCRSCASPGRVNAHAPTAAPSPPPSKSAAPLSSQRSRSATSQPRSTTTATATPPREYVSSTPTTSP